MPRRNQGPKLRWLEKRGCYYITWTDGGRSRQRSTGTADRREAEEVFAEWLHIRQRDAGPRDPSQVLINDLLADYAEESAERMTTPQRVGYALVPLSEFWTGKTAAQVSPLTCDEYRRWRDRSDGTIRRELGVMRAALNHAFSARRLTQQIPVLLPERPPSRDRWLTRTEAAQLLRAARAGGKSRGHLPMFILIGLYTGKRKEAILSLRWSQVDLERGLIDWETPGRRITKKRRGRNPINPKLLAHLRRARRWGNDLGPVVSYAGKPVLDVKRGFASACRRAGLHDVSPHTLRHTCATWLMQAGVPTWEASGFLGMSEETLIRVYGHHHPDHQRSAATAF